VKPHPVDAAKFYLIGAVANLVLRVEEILKFFAR